MRCSGTAHPPELDGLRDASPLPLSLWKGGYWGGGGGQERLPGAGGRRIGAAPRGEAVLGAARRGVAGLGPARRASPSTASGPVLGAPRRGKRQPTLVSTDWIWYGYW